MQLLITFDIVPVDSRVPQSAFGVAPASERAIRYALETYGHHDELAITAVHLTTDTIDLEENIAVAEMRTIADELDVTADISIHSVQDVESMGELRQEVLELIESTDVQTVVMGYEEESFSDTIFSGSTPARILEDQDTPVVLVP